jgi:preprotein translocase subunit SecD
LVSILAVLVIFASLGVYPIVAAHYGIHRPGWLMDKQLKLGLDLKGGVHLVLRVKTNEALQLQTDQAMERLREALSKSGINATIT